ncbi:MAG TPA: N-acetylmuramoyl-L-alanine amidase, partial [Gammaproteobacteria bacterium]|nr:N-acetylmuramoyl-L-alanine amidase [Gammaproteobacteria bacterium]
MKILIKDLPSVSFTPEIDINPKYIILHCIGYDSKKALDLLTKPTNEGGAGVSAHYFIEDIQLRFLSEDTAYPIYQLVPETKKAWHAGISSWRQDKNLNSCALGIEFNSPNYANAMEKKPDDELNWLHFEEFGDDQIKAGIELLKQLIQKYNIAPECILAHSDIAPWRQADSEVVLGKTDPGSKFPWEKLARAGIGVWPKNERTRTTKLDLSVENAQQLLSTYGYAVDVTGTLDEKTKYALRAFQWHFVPDQCDGNIIERTIIRLENLIDKQYQYQPLQNSNFDNEMK